MELEKSLIKVALYVSCNDGLLSEEEERQLIILGIKNFPGVQTQQVECWIEEFFEEDLQLESYCDLIKNHTNRLLALEIAIKTASADGLDFKENLALHRVMNYWEISWEEIING